MIALLNALIAFCCGLIAVLEYAGAHPSAALAYAGFGAGYVGLTLLYLGH